jgi:hypothetical protein
MHINVASIKPDESSLLSTGVLCSRLQRAMIPDSMNAIFPSEDGHVNARNMSRIIV